MVTHVHIETTSRCNARCVFCPHKDMVRPTEDMSDETFDAVVKDLSEWFSGVICPFLNGELFMDPKIFERMDRLAKLPIAFGIHTNGSLLSEERLTRLKTYKIQYFTISLQATSPESHKQRTGLGSWNHVLSMTVLARQMGLNPNFLFNGDQPIEDARKLAQLAGVSVNFAYTYTWRNKVGTAQVGQHLPTCEWVNNHVFILSDGRIVPCCMDLEGEATVGHIRDGIKKVNESQAMRPFRALRRGLIPFCSTCNMPPR